MLGELLHQAVGRIRDNAVVPFGVVLEIALMIERETAVDDVAGSGLQARRARCLYDPAPAGARIEHGAGEVLGLKQPRRAPLRLNVMAARFQRPDVRAADLHGTRSHTVGDTVVLARSAERREKEHAMHEKFSRRIEIGLASLADRIERARRPLDPATIQRQIGRLLQKNQRAAARYEVSLVEAGSPAGFHLNVKVSDAFDQWAKISEGTYALKTNVTDWDDEKLWRAYIQLAQAEAAFRVQKTELSIRPIWHQRADRVESHILVCFLAFVLWKTLELWQRRAELGNSPRTVLEEIKRIQCHDVCLPTATHGEIRLRCVTQPDELQSLLFDRLGITLPKRLRIDTDLPAALTA